MAIGVAIIAAPTIAIGSTEGDHKAEPSSRSSKGAGKKSKSRNASPGGMRHSGFNVGATDFGGSHPKCRGAQQKGVRRRHGRASSEGRQWQAAARAGGASVRVQVSCRDAKLKTPRAGKASGSLVDLVRAACSPCSMAVRTGPWEVDEALHREPNQMPLQSFSSIQARGNDRRREPAAGHRSSQSACHKRQDRGAIEEQRPHGSVRRAGRCKQQRRDGKCLF